MDPLDIVVKVVIIIDYATLCFRIRVMYFVSHSGKISQVPSAYPESIHVILGAGDDYSRLVT